MINSLTIKMLLYCGKEGIYCVSMLSYTLMFWCDNYIVSLSKLLSSTYMFVCLSKMLPHQCHVFARLCSAL